jgi:hypothetical protein
VQQLWCLRRQACDAGCCWHELRTAGSMMEQLDSMLGSCQAASQLG